MYIFSFILLQAAFDLSNTLSIEEQRSRLSEWVTRVELAADTMNELNTALEEILEQVKIRTQSKALFHIVNTLSICNCFF